MTPTSDFWLRRAEARDRTAFLNLARLSFMPMMALSEMEQELGDRPLNPVGQPGWVVEDAAGNLVARYRQFEFTLYFAGVKFATAGVGSVAVAVERRTQGVAQWMLGQALQHFREEGTLLSMLYPFRQGFYRNLGWARVGIAQQYRVSSRVLPLYAERTQLVSYQPHQESALKAFYATVAVQHNGWLYRAEWWWEHFFKPKAGRELYVYREDEQLLGYVVLEFAKLEPEKDQLAVIVREWVAQTPAAYRGIMGFLGSLRDQITTIVWNGAPDDPFPYLLTEQQGDPALTLPHFNFNYMRLFGMTSGGFMWRLVDPKAAIAHRPVQAVTPFRLAFHITDPVFGEDRFTVEFANGQAQVSSVVSSTPASTTIKTSVDHLAELFCGLRRSRQLHWTGELELEGDAALLTHLDAAWRAQPPFCWDAF